MRTAVGLGSNLGDRLDNLRAARKAILGLSTVKPPILCSPIYETDPVDCERGAEKFLNAVVEFDYEGDPANLLEQLIRIEEGLGRRRDHAKNVSRTIDIDLLYCGERNIENERLQLPHPAYALEKVCSSTSGRYPARPHFAWPEKNCQRVAEGIGEVWRGNSLRRKLVISKRATPRREKRREDARTRAGRQCALQSTSPHRRQCEILKEPNFVSRQLLECGASSHRFSEQACVLKSAADLPASGHEGFSPNEATR